MGKVLDKVAHKDTTPAGMDSEPCWPVFVAIVDDPGTTIAADHRVLSGARRQPIVAAHEADAGTPVQWNWGHLTRTRRKQVFSAGGLWLGRWHCVVIVGEFLPLVSQARTAAPDEGNGSSPLTAQALTMASSSKPSKTSFSSNCSATLWSRRR